VKLNENLVALMIFAALALGGYWLWTHPPDCRGFVGRLSPHCE
jgi:hypothetical protein